MQTQKLDSIAAAWMALGDVCMSKKKKMKKKTDKKKKQSKEKRENVELNIKINLSELKGDFIFHPA